MDTLQNKVALVTGGSSGIGQAVVRRLAAEGAKVFFSYNGHEAEAQSIKNAILKEGGQAAIFKANIAQPEDIRKLVGAAVQTYGKLDIAVLNAGKGILKPISESTEEEFDEIFNINAKGTFFSLKEAGAAMNDGGSIAVVSSSTTAFPIEGVALYAGSKAPLKLFVEVAAQEFGKRGISVNAVMPGVTLTRMAVALPEAFKQTIAATSPYNRLGNPEDLASVIYTLVGPDGHWVTGQTILANGGGKQ